MAKKSLKTWEDNTLGQQIDLDNQSYDCVDVPKSWAQYLTDKPWTESLAWGNAKDLYDNTPDTYWDHIPRGSAPQVGDIFVMSGAIGGGYGHTGVVVSVDGGNMTVYQQNTFTQQPVYTGVFSWNASYITGFLRSKIAFDIDVAAALAGWQRQCTPSDSVLYRDAPNRNGAILQKFDANDVVDFKGFVHGEIVESNDVWFVGRYTGGYSWSGGYTDTSTHDLTDLTPVAAALAGNQRRISGDVMNYRKTAQVAPDNVIRTYNPGEILTFNGFVHGQAVDGNDVWFRGDDGGFMWSGGLEDGATHDLTEIVTTTTPTPGTPTTDPTPPVVTPPAAQPYTFTKDLACVTEVIPAGLGSFEYGNFPTKPEKVVIHDFGTEGRDTIGSTINTFKLPNNISAHFVVSGDRIVQMVSLKDRAYHAGPNGNGFVGIESDPKQDAATINSVQLLLKALALYYGYVLTPIKHSSIMATLCGDDINLANYQIENPNSTPTIPDPDPVVPVPVPEAATSATKFVTRVATQAATASVAVQGVAAIAHQYTDATISKTLTGYATIVVALGLIFFAQFGYKLNAKFKWPF